MVVIKLTDDGNRSVKRESMKNQAKKVPGFLVKKVCLLLLTQATQISYLGYKKEENQVLVVPAVSRPNIFWKLYECCSV